MTTFSIGDFHFISLSRAFSRPVWQIEREIRPGFDGATFWRMGRRSEPMPLRSVVDVADLDAALATLRAYEQLVGENPVTVKWADRDLAQMLVFVHGVVPEEGGLHATLLGIGGLQGTSHAFLRCIWLVETLEPFISPSESEFQGQ